MSGQSWLSLVIFETGADAWSVHTTIAKVPHFATTATHDPIVTMREIILPSY